MDIEMTLESPQASKGKKALGEVTDAKSTVATSTISFGSKRKGSEKFKSDVSGSTNKPHETMNSPTKAVKSPRSQNIKS